MDPGDLCDALLANKKREQENMIFLRWAIASGILEAVTGSGVSLHEYKRSLHRPDLRSSKEILEEVDGYIEEFNSHGLKSVEVLDGII